MSNIPILDTLNKITKSPPPIWFMRQAGRYLPEYKEIRQLAGGFIELCLNPQMACEVTIQPIKRFNLNAAIVFSDILLITLALGYKLKFIEGKGPIISPVENEKNIPLFNEDKFHNRIKNVYETISRIKEILPKEIAIIGFAGSPWTVAAYMLEGGSSRDYTKIKIWAFKRTKSFQILIDLLIDATIEYLNKQILAGAQIIQLFDSWAGIAPESIFKQWIIEPTKKIVQQIKNLHPSIKIIGFARGAGAMIEDYASCTGIDAVGLDSNIPLRTAYKLQNTIPIQGNLDPIALLVGGNALKKETNRIIQSLSSGPLIFNLGHGVLPQTPINNVIELIKQIRS
ncbi:uroporphyrinogen decarboxylase [Candidatus Endolissoclinum faulkneri L5]|uniref:Uroporphyrinogen decarboxylase n=1 Tax=Candidatus Endolissoclinum faulkneri L5 TaxID=1401328 RepID=V9TV28_9PROT|nr:uroporphyrinogen decarboxylase [Candidatus Endolissoclinum faulkneri]AHC74022.1 uroporphyrinogen decarboxylase [Candidatus Endolissoclinum faulkneri L5]